MQHITPNSKRWDYSDIPGGSHGQIKGPTHMVEGGHHPRNRPPTLGTMSVDFSHYPVTVWAYSTPQPNTEFPAPTGGYNNRGYHNKWIIWLQQAALKSKGPELQIGGLVQERQNSIAYVFPALTHWYNEYITTVHPRKYALYALFCGSVSIIQVSESNWTSPEG